MARKIDAQTEVRIVALIARGDTYAEISKQLEKDGIEISASNLTDIKKRNTVALDQIKTSLIAHETTKTARILDKARKQIEDKLDGTDRVEKELAELKELYDEGKIDFKEYQEAKRNAERSNFISIKDLTTVSKEMFNQSQIESGKPTSIASNPEENKKNLLTLLKAINEKDEVQMIRSIFPDA